MRRSLVSMICLAAVLALVPAVGIAQGGPSVSDPGTAPKPTGAPFPAGYENDVYCSGFLGEEEEPVAGRIFDAEEGESQRSFIEGDVMYIDIGARHGVVAGQEYWIIRPGHLVERLDDPRYYYGRIHESPGRLRVICALESTAIAEITLSCDDVVVGDAIIPFEPIPIPLVRLTPPESICTPIGTKPTGRIVAVRDRVTPVAEGTVVYLDMGEAQGLVPGDFLTVTRVRNDGDGSSQHPRRGRDPEDSPEELGRTGDPDARQHGCRGHRPDQVGRPAYLTATPVPVVRAKVPLPVAITVNEGGCPRDDRRSAPAHHRGAASPRGSPSRLRRRSSRRSTSRRPSRRRTGTWAGRPVPSESTGTPFGRRSRC